MNDEYSRLTFAEEVIVIGCSCSCTGRNGHCADFHDTEIRNGELGAVGQQQQYPLLILQPQTQQAIPSTIYVGSQFDVGANRLARSDSRLLSPAFSDVSVYELVGQIAGNLVSRATAHTESASGLEAQRLEQRTHDSES